ncbi:MAG: butyrate kinase [Holdemanella sp.]|nr:butyrate kinase [Holdemanella sp.]
METYKIFVINPGSTSTKVELFENEKSIIKGNVFHDSSVLLQFPTINDQLDYRMEVTKKWLKENNVDLTGVSAIVGRGGACYSLTSGTYTIDDRMIADVRQAVGGAIHSSMLGIQMVKKFNQVYGGLMLTVDPVVVDEFQDVARVTGVKGMYRLSNTHALNLKATAKHHAKLNGLKYEDLNLIVAHIDGGITITAHEKGRQIDGINGSGGEGPLTPTRMGSMALTDFVRNLMDKPLPEVRKLLTQGGGFTSWLGTSNSDEIHKRIENGDKLAALLWEALAYQCSKVIGEMACVLKGNVDGIILTGGLMRFDDLSQYITDHCGWIAPVSIYPGELEHEAMRDGALRVLRHEESAKHYTGKPVFTGFNF